MTISEERFNSPVDLSGRRSVDRGERADHPQSSGSNQGGGSPHRRRVQCSGLQQICSWQPWNPCFLLLPAESAFSLGIRPQIDLR
ncbi:hypothetical protein HPP92_016454 [Vanilla planifolia]|uniref:Uncharacterized protein n=1 Tax=Vanilla planifolia TaxID=51239 RepID=A0A835QHK6_VANPL|nr:hypothetical protein HPP92_016454 [Vanilla planifolia]